MKGPCCCVPTFRKNWVLYVTNKSGDSSVDSIFTYEQFMSSIYKEPLAFPPAAKCFNFIKGDSNNLTFGPGSCNSVYIPYYPLVNPDKFSSFLDASFSVFITLQPTSSTYYNITGHCYQWHYIEYLDAHEDRPYAQVFMPIDRFLNYVSLNGIDAFFQWANLVVIHEILHGMGIDADALSPFSTLVYPIGSRETESKQFCNWLKKQGIVYSDCTKYGQYLYKYGIDMDHIMYYYKFLLEKHFYAEAFPNNPDVDTIGISDIVINRGVVKCKLKNFGKTNRIGYVKLIMNSTGNSGKITFPSVINTCTGLNPNAIRNINFKSSEIIKNTTNFTFETKF